MLFRFPHILWLMLLLGFAVRANAQKFTVCDSFPALHDRIEKAAGDGAVLINFWATWCTPCVEELPHFETLQQRYGAPGFKVMLVSLDFRSQIESRLKPFLNKNQLNSEVVLLADQDADTWIPRIHNAWDGAIPFTIVLKGNKVAIHKTKFSDYKALEDFVRPFMSADTVGAGMSKR